jgi:hypothetical protein
MPVLKKIKQRTCKICKEPYTPYNSLQPCCANFKCISEVRRLQAEKKLKKEIDSWRPEAKKSENAKQLQNQINLLARKIDARFYSTCIDCNKPYGKQVDGAHYHGRGSNSTLRYNLHNIHSASSQCNQYSDKHKQGYAQGLVARYGLDYASYVIDRLPLEIKEIKLTGQDIADKLKLVRYLNRTFDTYDLTDGVVARSLFNKLINIYP